jgi:hypothetical protein
LLNGTHGVNYFARFIQKTRVEGLRDMIGCPYPDC